MRGGAWTLHAGGKTWLCCRKHICFVEHINTSIGPYRLKLLNLVVLLASGYSSQSPFLFCETSNGFSPLAAFQSTQIFYSRMLWICELPLNLSNQIHWPAFIFILQSFSVNGVSSVVMETTQLSIHACLSHDFWISLMQRRCLCSKMIQGVGGECESFSHLQLTWFSSGTTDSSWCLCIQLSFSILSRVLTVSSVDLPTVVACNVKYHCSFNSPGGATTTALQLNPWTSL